MGTTAPFEKNIKIENDTKIVDLWQINLQKSLSILNRVESIKRIMSSVTEC